MLTMHAHSIQIRVLLTRQGAQLHFALQSACKIDTSQARAKALLLLNRFEDAMHQCQKSNQLDYDDDIYETQKTLEVSSAQLN